MNEKGLAIILCIFAAVSIAWLAYTLLKKKSKEGYLLGALGPYKSLYYRCLSECEKEDPSNYMGHANLMCSEYCDSMATEMQRKGGPSDEEGQHVAPPQVIETVDDCYARCGEGKIARKCRSNCACEKEVDERCRLECMHSNIPGKQCMELCSGPMRANCSSLSWTWKHA